MQWIRDAFGAGILISGFYAIALFLFWVFFNPRVARDCAMALTAVALAGAGILFWQIWDWW
jgi:hypothetical protein